MERRRELHGELAGLGVTPRRGRRVTGTTLLLLVPLVPLVLFGVARAAAPVSILGVLLDDPWSYVIVAVAAIVLGALLMALRPVERFAARALFGMRAPSQEESARVEPLLARACTSAGIDRDGLVLRAEDAGAINAYATAGHLLCFTTGALRLPDRQLEAVLAHELGHHSELHPWISALTWWLQLPAVPLKALLSWLRGAIGAVAARLGGLARPVGVVLLGLLWIITIQVLWLVWVADALAAWIARRTEFAADARAVGFGYGPALLEAYATLGGHSEPKGRLARLADFHPPMEDRIAAIQAQVRMMPGLVNDQMTHTSSAITSSDQNG
ncbi:MAG TPA: M48 family metalloprotease [Thermoleophilaceae bacterium]